MLVEQFHIISRFFLSPNLLSVYFVSNFFSSANPLSSNHSFIYLYKLPKSVIPWYLIFNPADGVIYILVILIMKSYHILDFTGKFFNLIFQIVLIIILYPFLYNVIVIYVE